MKSSSQVLCTKVQFATSNEGNYFNFINSELTSSSIKSILSTSKSFLLSTALWNLVTCIFRYKSICCYSGVSDIITTKEAQLNLVSTSGGHHENWGESTVAEASPRTDTSTDDNNQRVMSLALFLYLIRLSRIMSSINTS